MNEDDIGADIEQGVVTRGIHVLQHATRIDKEGKGAYQSVKGLLVGRVWTIKPPETKDAENKSGQRR